MSAAPITDRQRVQVLEARIAELEEELAAWRGNARDEAAQAAAAERFQRVRTRIRDLGPLGSGGSSTSVAKLLIHFLDHPGTVHPKTRLLAAVRGAEEGEDEPSEHLVSVIVCRARKAMAGLGVSGRIENVWSAGYRMSAEAAGSLRQALGLADG